MEPVVIIAICCCCFSVLISIIIAIYFATRPAEQTVKPVSVAPDANKTSNGSSAPVLPDSVKVSPRAFYARYIRLSNQEKSCMNIADIEVYSNGVNVAKGKTVTLSSVLDNTKYPATFLVDDIFTNFAHTSCNEEPLMTIDLGSSFTIDKIKVYNRQDCCSGRIAGSELFIFDDLLNPVFVSHKFKNKQGLTTTQNDHTGYMVYEINPPSNDVICS